jgi:hypothetical protein
MAPQDLHCSAVSPQSIRVRWDPPPPEHRNGIIEGYKVLYKHINLRVGEVHNLLKTFQASSLQNINYNHRSSIRIIVIMRKLYLNYSAVP